LSGIKRMENLMASPFPGMDPYLESRQLWRDVHHALIVAMRDTLAAQVAPDYYVAVEEEIYLVEPQRATLVGEPDVLVADPAHRLPQRPGGAATAVLEGARPVALPQPEEVREGYLEVRAVESHEVVTTIELLSRTNKCREDGRRQYERKRETVLGSRTSLVEIDLLREGRPMAMMPPPESDYRILIARGWEYPGAWVYDFGVREMIPTVLVPLRPEEPGASLSLKTVLDGVYERARYDLRINYSLPPEPPFVAADAAWAEGQLRTTPDPD
jgi:hypothetical protein